MIAFLRSLLECFYSASFYRELATKKRGIGLGFLFVATLLSFISLTQVKPVDAFFANKKAMFEALPEMSLQKGQLSSNETAPLTYVILDKDQGGPALVHIELTADFKNQEALKSRMEQEGIVLFVSASALAYFDKGKDRLEIVSFEQMPDRELTHQDWMGFNEATDLLFGFGLATLVLGFGFLFHLASAALGGLLLKAVAPLFSAPLPYTACLRLAAAAKIPVGTVALLVTPYAPLQTLLWFGFAAFGLLAQRSKQVGKAPEIS